MSEALARDSGAVGTSALVVSLVATGVVLAVARRTRHLDVPNERSSHAVPTPRSGGLGIVAAFAATPFAVGGLSGAAPLAALAIACAAGVVDDVRGLRPLLKMVALLGAAAVVVPSLAVEVARDVPFAGDVPLGFLALPLTALWLALYANAFNFMDGIDGIASLTSAVSGAAFAAAGVRAGDAELAGWGAAVCGASLGFLPWNFPGARIFLGDAGSLPLGFALAWCAVRANATGALAFPASVLLLGPFLFDVAFTLGRRWREGKTIGEAHREHLYQRLARRAGSHPPATIVYAGFAAATGALALGYAEMSSLGKLLSLVLPSASMLGFAGLVLRAERANG